MENLLNLEEKRQIIKVSGKGTSNYSDFIIIEHVNSIELSYSTNIHNYYVPIKNWKYKKFKNKLKDKYQIYMQ